MKGKPAIYLLAAILSVFAMTARAATPTCSLSAHKISREIKQRGIQELMHRLSHNKDTGAYDYTGFNQLMGCIWSGKKEWLDIAVPVIAETQPDSEDDPTDAVQNALSANPEAVLSEPWPDFFTIQDYICSVSVDDYSNYGDAIAELNRREKIVRRISRPDLKEKANECLAAFEQTRKNLGRIYQIDKSSTANPPTHHIPE